MVLKVTLFFALLFGANLFSQENVRELGELPNAVSETSGLIFHNGRLITHNDSGNTAQLFEIDTTSLQIIRTVTILNAENIDWEDITQDEDFIYIGDFGNNRGTRTDLVVYRVSKQAYDQSDAVSAERLDFRYEDQFDFIDNSRTDWDAEALFALNDELIILTKQWTSNGTVAYAIPKTPGTYEARKIETYDANGLITGATYNPLSDVLFLIGYNAFLGPFTIRVERPTNSAIFSGAIERLAFGSGLAQTEGITYVDQDTYFVSSESFSNTSPPITLTAQLFAFETIDSDQNPVNPVDPVDPVDPIDPIDPNENPQELEDRLLLYRPFGSHLLEYELTTDRAVFGRAIHEATGKQLQYVLGSQLESNTLSIDLSTFGNAVYYLTFYLDNGVISEAFTK